MDRKTTLRRFVVSLFLATLPVVFAFAQAEPNPNSPTPVLLSGPDPARALTSISILRTKAARSVATAPEIFELNGQVVLYVTNVELMKGEGASAFRVYVIDAKGRLYRFPVVGLETAARQNNTYALRVELRDELGYSSIPPERGDVLVSVAWRGLESNRLRLALGGTGGLNESVKTWTSGVYDGGDESNVVGYLWSGDRMRFLEQSTFGPTKALDTRVRRLGLRTWLADQFETAYPSNPYPAFQLVPTFPPPNCNGQIDGGSPDPDPFCFVNHYTMYPVQNWFYREAFYGDAQLRHRVAWALAQLWVISGVDTQQSSHMTAYHKVLSRNAFGNWRTLMQEMTLNPGMGDYLNMRTSTRFSPNENFAREVLQLFNVGLFMLNPDGTLIRDAQNNPIPTYNQDTVDNFTRLLTGWTLCEVTGPQCPNRFPGAPNFIDPMIVTNPDNHDLGTKTLLTYTGSTTTNVPACTGCSGSGITNYANNSLNIALDNIYNHPNVAPFVSKFLIQQLVTGDPTPAYVGRVSAVFNANRANPTQLKEVIKAILLDPEARGDLKTEPTYGKLREPVMFLTNIARQFDVRSADRSVLSDGVVTNETNPMGQIAFMSPTVFNFYPPDYVVPGTTFVSPEFSLLTSGTSVARINFINTMVFNRIDVNTDRRVTLGTSLSFADLQALAAADPSGNMLMDDLNHRMMHGAMPGPMRATILNAILTVPASDPLQRAKRAVYLVATSSQYQVQR